MDGKYLQLRRLLLWRDLSLSWDPQQSFVQRNPLHLEIGFGNGEYLARQAASHPERNYLGMELHWESVRRCLRRLAQQDLDNVRLLQVDVQSALRWLLPDACLDGFVALFPCPWPKRQQERFRLFSTSLMSHLNRVCKPGAKGLVVTDHPGLRDYALAQAQGSGLGVQLVEVPPTYNTKYERRWTGEGQQVFYELHYHRVAPADVLRPAEVDVQTLFLDNFEPEAMERELQGEVDGLVVEFRQQLYDPKKERWMVLTTVVEDSLSQTFWIEVARKDGKWCIRPSLGGGYLPTIGVQRAMHRIRDTALQLSEQPVQRG